MSIHTNEWRSMAELMEEFLAEGRERSKWFPLFESATTYIDKLKAIRLYYSLYEERIVNHCKNDRYTYYDAYAVDWVSLFTPIEQKAWSSIRSKGGLVLYPQYPVLGYFIDFANPLLKIGLELDGKQYHVKERDSKRDYELSVLGWRIYRVTGSEMNNNSYKDFYDFEEDELFDEYNNCDDAWSEIKNWILYSGDGVIEAIKHVHFSRGETDHRLVKYCQDSLETHRSL